MFTRFARIVAPVLVATGAAAWSSAPASADPVGQCPPGWLTADASFGPATAALDLAGNNDGFVCRLIFKHGPNAGFANIVDNSIPLHVPFATPPGR